MQNGKPDSHLISTAMAIQSKEKENMKLNIWEWNFERTSYKTPNFIVYSVTNKTLSPKEEDFSHAKVIKIRKIRSEEELFKTLELAKLRKELIDKDNSYIIYYDQDTFLCKNSGLYYAVLYDDPDRHLYEWITIDHQGLKMEMLYVYYILKDIILALVYLEENKLILTQLNYYNLFAGSISEDRFNFIKLGFKGYRAKSLPDESYDPNVIFPRDLFAPPETDGNNPYKSNLFQLGIAVLWCIHTNNSLPFDGKFYLNTPQNHEALLNAIDTSAKSIEACPENSAEQFADLMRQMLTYDVNKRPSPKELAKHKYLAIMNQADEDCFKRQVEANERAKQRETEEKEKNQYF